MNQLRANTILKGRYKILGVMGGTYSVVYQARDLNFPEAKRLVAVKEMEIITATITEQQKFIDLFNERAERLINLSHPGLEAVRDYFRVYDRVYLVTTFINGTDLEMLIHKTTGLPTKKILEWAIDLCDTLYYLHTLQPKPYILGVLLPTTIVIDNLGRVRLHDLCFTGFQYLDQEPYEAPEVYKAHLNPQVDIYSLGLHLHYLLTRKNPRLEPPFSASLGQLPIKQFNPTVPDEFVAIIEKALQFEPHNRWQSAVDMRAALEKLQL